MEPPPAKESSTFGGVSPKRLRMRARACSERWRPPASPSCTSHRHRWATNCGETPSSSASSAPSTAARATTSGRRAHQTWRVEMWPWRTAFSRRASAESSLRGKAVSIKKRVDMMASPSFWTTYHFCGCVHFHFEPVHNCGRDNVKSSPPLALSDEHPSVRKARQQMACLRRRNLAQLGGLPAGDAPVGLHVLQDHLLLLQGFKAAAAHVGRWVPQPAVDRSGEMIDASLSFTPRLQKPAFDQTLQDGAGVGFRFLD